MLVDFDRHLVLITPPKCGTSTLHEVLPRFGVKAILGPQFDFAIGEHTTLLPYDVWSQLNRFRFVVVTRNPYTRAASLYAHYRRYWPPPHLVFADFLERIVIAPRYAFFNATITSMIHPLENPLDGRLPVAVDASIRLQALEDDLRCLGYSVNDGLPKIHALDGPGVSDYTPRTKDLVDLWSYHDFERFGYPRDLSRAYDRGRNAPADAR